MNIWYDITNTPQVHFLLAIDNILKEIGVVDSVIYSARDFSETTKMLEDRIGEDNFTVIGSHYGKSYLNKVLGLFKRFIGVYNMPFKFDLSISCGSECAIWTSYIKRKKSIAFGDNDLARQWTYAPMVSYAFFPTAIPTNILEKQGLKGKLYQYNGYKEDVYLAYYKPSTDFLLKLPFEHYVVVRPENVMANYIRKSSLKSIVPELLQRLTKQGYNVLYLPRYTHDRAFADGLNNIFIPEKPINGLDACFYADAVLTGAGTFAREAACLGIPSFSFFLGERLLSVDEQLIKEGRMFYSRCPDDIIKRLIVSNKQHPDLERCLDVKEEIKSRLVDVLKFLK